MDRDSGHSQNHPHPVCFMHLYTVSVTSAQALRVVENVEINKIADQTFGCQYPQAYSAVRSMLQLEGLDPLQMTIQSF